MKTRTFLSLMGVPIAFGRSFDGYYISVGYEVGSYLGLNEIESSSIIMNFIIY